MKCVREAKQIRGRRSEDILVLLFGILPVIDMLNGLFRGMPIGIIYKFLLCIALFFNKIQCNGKVNKKNSLIVVLAIIYIFLSVFINVVLLNGEIINTDYPIKLIFNITMMALFIDNCHSRKLSSKAISRILDISSWMMIICFLVPYLLGLGVRVYGYGYKSFFIAQNELNLIVVVLLFFTSYKLTVKISIADLIREALLLICAILLNSKTALIACLIATGMWVISTLKKAKLIYKISTIMVIVIGIYLFKDRFVQAVSNSLIRQNALQSRYYGNSSLAGVLSGRNFFVEEAWNDLIHNHTLFRFFFGNGFCSSVLCEMDLFDIFFYLGIVGMVAAIFFLGWIFRESLNMSRIDRTLFRPISFLTICMLLTLAGHVLFMAMSGCYFIIYCSFLIYYKETAFSHIIRKR